MKKIYRSIADKKIAGVCSGIGHYFNIDPTLIRIVVVIATIATGFMPFIVGYLAFWFIIPEMPTGGSDISDSAPPPGFHQ